MFGKNGLIILRYLCNTYGTDKFVVVNERVMTVNCGVPKERVGEALDELTEEGCVVVKYAADGEYCLEVTSHGKQVVIANEEEIKRLKDEDKVTVNRFGYLDLPIEKPVQTVKRGLSGVWTAVLAFAAGVIGGVVGSMIMAIAGNIN